MSRTVASAPSFKPFNLWLIFVPFGLMRRSKLLPFGIEQRRAGKGHRLAALALVCRTVPNSDRALELASLPHRRLRLRLLHHDAGTCAGGVVDQARTDRRAELVKLALQLFDALDRDVDFRHVASLARCARVNYLFQW